MKTQNHSFLFALKNYQSALIAALFFGCIAPGTRYFVTEFPPQSLAGILYTCAGAGLLMLLLLKGEWLKAAKHFKRADGKWLGGATFFGGILGPAFLTYGMQRISGSSASLLLNLEAVFTSLIAWFVFKEHFEKRIVWGMTFIVFGCVILSYGSQSGGQDTLLGIALITGACLSWSVDNNLTRNISHLSPLLTASIKGIVAGMCNLALGHLLGERIDLGLPLLLAGGLGFLGIGVSLVAFILSLKTIGTARTGAVFSTAPFVGAIISILGLGEPLTFPFVIALGLMGIGVYLHLSETHEHEHEHESTLHTHEHIHDEHHQHEHDPRISPQAPHTHFHKHSENKHSHPHFPDLHHRHSH